MLSGDKVRRVNHNAEEDRAILRMAYKWAKARPDLYIDGKGYRDAEHFLEKPGDAVEYFVFAGGNPAALLTLTRHEPYRDIFDVGLITNPEANLRAILKLLRGFMAIVFGTMAEALYVQLPPRAEFSTTKKLAHFFGFKQIAANTFLIFKSEYESQDGNQAAAAAND